MERFKKHEPEGDYYITHFTYKNKHLNSWRVGIGRSTHEDMMDESELKKSLKLLNQAKRGKLRPETN